jgi:WD40 repeat protein
VSGCAWLVTKSKDGVGFLSVYKIACGALDGEGVIPLATIELVKIFSAHDHGITRIAIGGVGSAKESDTVNNELDPGLYFATASLQGTIIRVFQLINCNTLYELQRGSSSCVIHSMAFNGNASLLAVSGSKGTIHLFHLNEDNQLVQGSTSHDVTRQVGIAGYMKRFTSNSNNDGQIIRSFARLRLKGENSRKPNTITVLDSVQEDDIEENIAICLGNGTLLQYAVRYNGKKRPIRAEDLLFHTDSE